MSFDAIEAASNFISNRTLSVKLEKSSILYFNKAIDKSSKVDARLYLNRAISFLKLGEYDKALVYQNKALASIDDNISNSAIQPIMPAGVSACSTEGQKIKAEHEAKKSGGCGSG